MANRGISTEVGAVWDALARAYQRNQEDTQLRHVGRPEGGFTAPGEYFLDAIGVRQVPPELPIQTIPTADLAYRADRLDRMNPNYWGPEAYQTGQTITDELVRREQMGHDRLREAAAQRALQSPWLKLKRSGPEPEDPIGDLFRGRR